MTDLQLHSRFRAGEETAVRDVYEQLRRRHVRHGDVGVGQSRPRRRRRAAGLRQGLARVAHLRSGRELRPWLATITRRAAIDVYRRELTARRSAAGTDQDATVIPVAFERTWEAFEVRSALEQLPPDEREVMRLSHFEGLAHPEIAEKLGVPVGTVKSRSHRAHRRLASLLSHLVESAS